MPFGRLQGASRLATVANSLIPANLSQHGSRGRLPGQKYDSYAPSVCAFAYAATSVALNLTDTSRDTPGSCIVTP